MRTTNNLRKDNPEQAFTLVELLAVIAMLLLIASMLFPALARTRPNVKTADCLNNARQWATAMQIHANNNLDSPPRDGLSSSGVYGGTGPDGTILDTNAWFNLLPQLLGERPLKSYFDEPGGNLRVKLPFPGDKRKLWHCPGAYMTDADYALVSGGGGNGFFSYNMNIDLKRQDASTSIAYPLMPKLSTYQKPFATILFFDAAFNPRTEAVNTSPQFNSVNPAARYRNFVARHGNGGVISFLGGQAKVFTAYYVTNGFGSFEPLRPDLIWNSPYRLANP